MQRNKIHLNKARNAGELHRAISLGEKMRSAGLWDGEADIYFNSPAEVSDALREFQLSGELKVDGIYTIK